MNWINANTILKGEIVELIPLQEKHFVELELLAREKRIWEFLPIDMSTSEKCIHAFANALIERENGTQFPFVIFHKQEKKIIGSTRLMNIEPVHKKLEIGWTWLHPDYWATAINLECKLLLLTFCFEELKTIRVQLKTSVENIRSRRAIEKIGGHYEGILRYDMIRDNGTKRNSAYYSIIEDEWESVKSKIKNIHREKLQKVPEKIRIEFDDFIVRQMEIEDADTFSRFIIKNKKRLAPSSPVTVRTVTDAESAKKFIANRNELTNRKEQFTFTLFQNDNRIPIANLVIKSIDWTVPKGEIGYYIDEDFERKGITTQFVNTICNYAFKHLGFNKLFMRIRNENIGSKRIAEKNGFGIEGIMLKDFRNHENVLVDLIYYSKLNIIP
jgi:RimJ/RimL family protein N-acetyltransferase